MDQPYEIEAKFVLPEARAAALLAELRQLGPYTLVPAADESQRNTYFDTADLGLARQNAGLRVRELGTRRIATFKSGGQVQAGIHMRGEWEQELGDDARVGEDGLSLEHWPPGPVREMALRATGGARLLPVVRVQTLRRNLHVSHGDRRVATLSIDEGVIAANGRELPFRELEIELYGEGERADLDRLIALLQGELPLEPEDRSKLARGLELLREGDGGRRPAGDTDAR